MGGAPVHKRPEERGTTRCKKTARELTLHWKTKQEMDSSGGEVKRRNGNRESIGMVLTARDYRKGPEEP